MKRWDYLQNTALLAAACGMAYAWDTAWPFLLLFFWLRPND